MKYGPIQRGDQRNDEGNRQSEQRRLHGNLPLSTLRLTWLARHGRVPRFGFAHHCDRRSGMTPPPR